MYVFYMYCKWQFCHLRTDMSELHETLLSKAFSEAMVELHLNWFLFVGGRLITVGQVLDQGFPFPATAGICVAMFSQTIIMSNEITHQMKMYSGKTLIAFLHFCGVQKKKNYFAVALLQDEIASRV